jgi:hypothetical protein
MKIEKRAYNPQSFDYNYKRIGYPNRIKMKKRSKYAFIFLQPFTGEINIQMDIQISIGSKNFGFCNN